MLHFLTVGTLLGLSAGFAPGPLLTLVLSETLQHDVTAGVKVALAPVITDLPIIAAALYVLAQLPDSDQILGAISLLGGAFILYLGCSNLRAKSLPVEGGGTTPRSLLKGVLANALNPHPYLFWLCVGAPTMSRAMSHGRSSLLAFIGSFYILLVGSKILLAVLVGKSKSFLGGQWYLYTMRFLGIALCVLSLLLFRDGLELLGIFPF